MELGFWLRVAEKRDMFDFLSTLLLIARKNSSTRAELSPVLTEPYEGYCYVGIDSLNTAAAFVDELIRYGVKYEALMTQPSMLVVECVEAWCGDRALIDRAFVASVPARLQYRWL
jgi:hypothetical protein